MCGIGGIYSFSGEPVSRERLARLSLALMHRGPDGEGEFLSSGIGLVHRRLAVIDPTERSAQPAKDMASGSALSFNGEVYNFQELRKELGREGERFDSDGDVEVLFKGLLRHGVDFIRRVDGDFAFAFWDGRSRTLFLARDRFGIKPLYYATGPGEIVFASEIKAILAAGHEARVRHSTLHEHLRFRYAQGEETLFDGIISLPPGEIAEVGAKGVSRKRYWSIDPERFQYGDYEEGLEKLDALWERSIRGRMISDVPLGTLLSGGIDSGFIAQSMEPLADGPITAMTYEVPGKLSEVRASRLLADELGYAHSVVSHRGDFFQQLPEVIRALEEPLGDSIVVPNYELFKESRKKMTVVVSGEGADEIFGGYAHHRILKSLFDLQSAGLKPALSFAAKAIPWISPRALSKLIPYPVQFDGALLDRAQALLGAPKPQDSYDTARTLIDEPELAKLLDPQFRGDVNKGSATWNDGAPWTQVLLSDIHGWLPNYGLLRVDKLSMAHGLECRVPYLQHEFAEAALAMTVREASRVGFPVKRVLRDLVRRRYPHSSYARRRKQPFFLPTEKTRDRALEDLVDNYLSEGALKKTGIFSPSAVHRLMKGPDSFLKAKKMVSILHLQIWMDVFRVSIS